MPENKALDRGRLAYEAYRAHTGGVSLATGQPIPRWDGLRPEIQAAWRASAEVLDSTAPTFSERAQIRGRMVARAAEQLRQTARALAMTAGEPLVRRSQAYLEIADAIERGHAEGLAMARAEVARLCN